LNTQQKVTIAGNPIFSQQRSILQQANMSSVTVSQGMQTQGYLKTQGCYSRKVANVVTRTIGRTSTTHR